MKTGKFLPFFIVLCLLLFFSSCQIYNACHSILSLQKNSEAIVEVGKPRIEYIESIPVVHLYGSDFEMGQQYGQLLSVQLIALEDIVNAIFSEKKVEGYKQQALQSEHVLPIEIKQFLKGVSLSSDVSENSLLALNLVPRISCSVLAVWGNATANGNLLMGRNADYNLKRINKALGILVVKHPTNGFATVASSFIGLAGSFTGMNEKGVCFGNMLVYNGLSDVIKKDGMPIQLLMQQGGEKYSSAREMIEYLCEQKHMIPENVMCADSSEAIIAELSQELSVIREGHKEVLAATNFSYSSGMFKKAKNDQRFADLMFLAKKNYGLFNIELLQEAMHKARGKNKNLQCVLFEPALMKMYVSMNKVPASKGPFTEFDVQKLFSN
ncbi:MAG: C45 family autoproteolytic acyltransferase/hydrolase [Prolixibacteraceae bacterium]|jgi:isopenicillin-N N-acyltransferase-like protein|nr:C45 family autoproteolytic acyltransferase/hydrolase [Prolixibacteraceae bacterium]